jgi:hypothetical protein
MKIKTYKIEVLYGCETRPFALRDRGNNGKLKETANEELRFVFVIRYCWGCRNREDDLGGTYGT